MPFHGILKSMAALWLMTSIVPFAYHGVEEVVLEGLHRQGASVVDHNPGNIGVLNWKDTIRAAGQGQLYLLPLWTMPT